MTQAESLRAAVPVPTVSELDAILRKSLPAGVVYAIRPTGDPFTGWARMMLGTDALREAVAVLAARGTINDALYLSDPVYQLVVDRFNELSLAATPPVEGLQVTKQGMRTNRHFKHVCKYCRAEYQPLTPPTEGLDVTAERLVDAVLTWKSGAVVEGLAHEYRRLALAATPPTEGQKQADIPVSSMSPGNQTPEEPGPRVAATPPTEGLDVAAGLIEIGDLASFLHDHAEWDDARFAARRIARLAHDLIETRLVPANKARYSRDIGTAKKVRPK